MSSLRSPDGLAPQPAHLARANPAAKGSSPENAYRTAPVPPRRGATKALPDLLGAS
ncbi:hypothetical protein [Micromonospora sp. NPDC092111]|uniref:hypothetical protein n=1 Tax=Micromonospora sp. NPDC092111 TaxID=3364289 RepID=UPI0038290669